MTNKANVEQGSRCWRDVYCLRSRMRPAWLCARRLPTCSSPSSVLVPSSTARSPQTGPCNFSLNLVVLLLMLVANLATFPDRLLVAADNREQVQMDVCLIRQESRTTGCSLVRWFCSTLPKRASLSIKSQNMSI